MMMNEIVSWIMGTGGRMTGTRTESGLCACTELLCNVKKHGLKENQTKELGCVCVGGYKLDLNPLELREAKAIVPYHPVHGDSTLLFPSQKQVRKE